MCWPIIIPRAIAHHPPKTSASPANSWRRVRSSTSRFWTTSSSGAANGPTCPFGKAVWFRSPADAGAPAPLSSDQDSRLRSRWSSPCVTRCGSLPFARSVLRLHFRSVAFAPRGRGGAAYDWPCPNPMRATMKTMDAPSCLRRTRPPYARGLLRARSQCSRQPWAGLRPANLVWAPGRGGCPAFARRVDTLVSLTLRTKAAFWAPCQSPASDR